MTRINCVPVTELVDKHLIAEYRELPRVFKLARSVGDKEVAGYTMGRGHVTFFYNKLLWCYKRQHALCNEMKRRGFKPNFVPTDLSLQWKPRKPDLWNDWEPSEKDMEINRARIKERLDGK